MRIIGMDIHRVAAEVVSLLDGEIIKLGRVQMLRNKLEEFARRELTHDDHVVIEATGNAAAVAEVLSPYVNCIVIANPKRECQEFRVWAAIMDPMEVPHGTTQNTPHS